VLAHEVTDACAALRRPRDAAAIGAYSLLIWLFESLMFAFVMPVFALKIELANSVATMGVTNLGTVLPSGPAFVGSFHFFCSRVLLSQGVPEGTVMAFALMTHLAFVVPVTLWGAGAVLRYGARIASTMATARGAARCPRTQTLAGMPVQVIARWPPPQPQRDAASSFELALADALLSPSTEGAGRSPALRRRVYPPGVVRAATFLMQEMDALPPRLRLLYRLGMATFRAYVRLRYARSFCALDLRRRRHVVQAWAFGNQRLLRQLFRPVRSTALLAYYENGSPAPYVLASVRQARSFGAGAGTPTGTQG
jgi:hypothetical protein